MHICFVSLAARGAFFPGQGRIGGAEMQVRRFADYLTSERGWRVTAVVGDDGQPGEEECGAVRLLKVPQPSRGSGKIAKLKREARSALNLMKITRRAGADVYVQRSAGAETWLAARAARSAGRPFVFMSANDWEFEPPWSTGGGMTHKLYRRGLKNAALRLVQTIGQRENMKSVFGLDSEVLHNIFAFSSEPQIPEGRAMLWAGRCRAQKSPMAFIELMRRLPDIPAIMLAAPTPYEKDLFAEVRAAASALPNCEWIPGAPPGEMPALYRRASILVNTSTREGVPNTFIEAADAGLALATLGVDPHGMIRKSGAGVCADGDLEKLSGEIARLHSDENARRTLALKARCELIERHDWRRAGERLAALLEKAAGHE